MFTCIAFWIANTAYVYKMKINKLMSQTGEPGEGKRTHQVL